MIEATTNVNTREAIRRAHEERAQAARHAWAWLFHPATSR